MILDDDGTATVPQAAGPPVGTPALRLRGRQGQDRRDRLHLRGKPDRALHHLQQPQLPLRRPTAAPRPLLAALLETRRQDRLQIISAEDAALYQEWINNRQRLEAALKQMRDISRQAGRTDPRRQRPPLPRPPAPPPRRRLSPLKPRLSDPGDIPGLQPPQKPLHTPKQAISRPLHVVLK